MTALLVLMHAYPLVLMHAYPSAYAYRFDYVRLRCHLIMPTCLCLWLLTVAYDIYARLCMFVYLLMVYGVSEGKICWNYTVWRKGKWLVGILVLKLDKGIYVYKGTCPPAALSFFPPHATSCILFNTTTFFFYPCSPVLSPSVPPSRPSCPRPRLVKPPRFRPHRAKSRPSHAPVRITKSRVSRSALPLHCAAAPSPPCPLPSSHPRPP
jgi:hypothetical protein